MDCTKNRSFVATPFFFLLATIYYLLEMQRAKYFVMDFSLFLCLLFRYYLPVRRAKVRKVGRDRKVRMYLSRFFYRFRCRPFYEHKHTSIIVSICLQDTAILELRGLFSYYFPKNGEYFFHNNNNKIIFFTGTIKKIEVLILND